MVQFWFTFLVTFSSVLVHFLVQLWFSLVYILVHLWFTCGSLLVQKWGGNIRYARQIISAIGGIIILVLLALTRHFQNQIITESLIYSVIIEICILLITHPYNIVNYLLSVQSRWILVTVIIINTITIRTHLTIEYVAFPIIISILAILAIVRNDLKWKAFRGYREDDIIQKAMSLNEESSAWKSWIYHGKQRCIEMAYRVSRYTGTKPFDPKYVNTWNDVQQSMENHNPVKIKQSFAMERMIDFMGMCYRAGFLSSVSYKSDLLEKTESLKKTNELLEEANTLLKEREREIKSLKDENERSEKELLYYIEESRKLERDIEYTRNFFIEERKNNEQSSSKRIKEMTEYCEELERKIDMYEREIQSLRQQMEIMEESEQHRIEYKKAVGESVLQSEEHESKIIPVKIDNDNSKMKRARKDDVERIKKLRDEGHTIAEIAEMTGFSVSTVKRKIY